MTKILYVLIGCKFILSASLQAYEPNRTNDGKYGSSKYLEDGGDGESGKVGKNGQDGGHGGNAD